MVTLIHGIGTLVVKLDSGHTSAGRAQGGPTRLAYDGTTATGATLAEASSLYEVTTGQHVAGATSNITMTVDPAFAKTVFVNPSPGNGAAISPNQADAMSAFRHEIDHGLGVTGYYTQSGTAEYGRGPGGYLTAFDTLLQENAGGTAYFTGANTEAICTPRAGRRESLEIYLAC